ncbi:hypothetical protein O3L50_004601 [Salmonella enterica]|uniref:Fimbrial protein n=1 Tax=Salmonella enterica subsp. enterica serovar Javiana TaxID=363569 RepID=A0A607K956_SALET|nr:hypothetical protein [Salmonella enterica]EAR0120229.1 hypothetical protein [Salmonella enterica subsp. enterica serovar Javiana]EBF4799596.1 hypothetical protein [Salmonella enterica subsp. enterica]EDY0542920.1 hypothetical protein [Salmonella enterica subsp. enterica serovar Panama]EAN6964511.1 hypothetical protein [Salmonella enterica]
MKKAIIASAIAVASLGMMNTASAGNGEVQFIGAVTATTCDLSPEVGGSVTSLVQLGTASLNAAAAPVTFSLKADSGQSDCSALDAAKTATISWAGQFNAQGLANQNGTATGAWMKLTAQNAKTAAQVVTDSASSVEFAGDEIKNNGALFEATLNGGAAAGDFKSAAAFVVAYK